MVVIYSDYSRARIGHFFGLSGWQLAVVTLSLMPVFVAVNAGAWVPAAGFALAWALVVVVTVTPVRGRSATNWAATSVAFAIGTLTGWTRFRSRAAAGSAAELHVSDLPGVLAGVEIHDGPPQGPAGRRVAVVQDHTTRTWAVTASVVHPGIGMSEADERARFGTGLSELLDLASRTELVDELLLLVRTVPEDGAERDQWLTRHRNPDGPTVARVVNDELQAALTGASVRTEAFITLVVPESRLGKAAKEAGGGVEGRARVLYSLTAECDAQLRGAVGMTTVEWLTSPQLAAACRTGFAPGDRAGIIDALAAHQSDPAVCTDVPWAMAGPSGADPAARHYSHDAWNSISATIKLPVKGAAMGALAPILTPTEPGERRCLLVAFPIISATAADRQSASSEWAADMGDGLRTKAKVKPRTRAMDEAAKVRGLDRKLARGSSLTRPYAVATVTVAKTVRVAEFGRRLDASVRRAGFAPLRLDLSQDVAFAVSTIPLGVSLTRTGDA